MEIREQVKTLTDKVKAEIHRLDRQIASLHERKQEIRSAPLPKVEALAAAEAAIRQSCTMFRSDGYLNSIASLARWNPPDGARQQPMRLLRSRHSQAPDLDALVYFLQDVMRERVTADVEELYRELKPGMPAKKRAAALADLDDQIEALEAEREAVADQVRDMFAIHAFE